MWVAELRRAAGVSALAPTRAFLCQPLSRARADSMILAHGFAVLAVNLNQLLQLTCRPDVQVLLRAHCARRDLAIPPLPTTALRAFLLSTRHKLINKILARSRPVRAVSPPRSLLTCSWSSRSRSTQSIVQSPASCMILPRCTEPFLCLHAHRSCLRCWFPSLVSGSDIFRIRVLALRLARAGTPTSVFR